MKKLAACLPLICLLMASGFGFDGSNGLMAGEIDFLRDVKPILSDKCFHCHGPDSKTREADLRLDTFDGATRDLDGYAAIVPGKASQSEAYLLMITDDKSERMPPKKSEKQLTKKEITTIKAWIDQGAKWADHWAYVAPKQAALPKARARHPIDRFVQDRLKQAGLSPSPETDKASLLRRISLDLTGLPPTISELDDFISDRSPDAYEKAVDRLLSSPAYGEHMARYWLDAARYADTNGFQYDRERTQWPWRDWVIWAYNKNMPFDEFTRQQLAGDLLPNATDRTRLATGFNRNHPITTEGGIIPEEYRTEYVSDRVVTMGTIWLGQTLLCSRCHDHKYDPISQKEFFQLFAFFNQVPEAGNKFEPRLSNTPMLLHDFKPDAKAVAGLQKKIKDLEAKIQKTKKAKKKVSGRDSKNLGKLKAQLRARQKGPSALVMADKPGIRKTHILERGEYNKPGEVVTTGVPAILPPMKTKSKSPNRLDLANWLVSGEHPLTARVTVNRLWQRFFGMGLVKTTEDFGSQGAWPSHPKLLDWLAVEYVKRSWDTKAMIKLIVTSETYKQSSRIDAKLNELDPENRLLARGPRMRMAGEVIRDSALFSSGLLMDKLGGPPVYPYHPEGLWLELNNRPNYSKAYPHTTEAKHLYRRSLYSFWKRTVPQPSMTTFDAPEREFCVIERSRTNTPLQAFVLMNDPQFVEAARFLARRMIKEGGSNEVTRLTYGFRLVTSRKPNSQELNQLKKTLAARKARYGKDKVAAEKLLKVGQPDDFRHDQSDYATYAAYTAVARILLNLSESITKG